VREPRSDRTLIITAPAIRSQAAALRPVLFAIGGVFFDLYFGSPFGTLSRRMTSSTAPEPVAPSRRSSPWTRRLLVFVSCVLLLDALFGDKGLTETLRARQDLRRASANLDNLTRENAAMREQVRRLQGDPAAIKAVARKDLGLVRRGEILIVLKDLP
jgi:cell division protein FtsB